MLPVREILRVVFDTNVLAAALRSKNGASYQLISLLFANKFKIAVSLPLYMEYLDVLLRPTVKPTGISDADILDFVDEILQHAQTQNIYFLWRPWLKDAKDDMILELAIASQADYIVTFNLKGFPQHRTFWHRSNCAKRLSEFNGEFMSAVTVELPNALQQRLEKIAEQSGVSVSQLLIEAAEKMSQVEILEQIKREAAKRNTRAGFERVMQAIPDVEPENLGDKIK